MKMVLLEAPRSKDAKIYREWLELGRGKKFDPSVFDLDETNRQIMTMINFIRENTGEYKRIEI